MRRLVVTQLVLAVLALGPRGAWAQDEPAKAAPAAKRPRKRAPSQPSAPEVLHVPGAPDAYYFPPNGGGLQPVLMYLHGRNGHAANDCLKWARVGRPFGWVVCPQGGAPGDNGGRQWSSGGASPAQIVDATLQALRSKFNRRVQLRGNVLIGFSEGAFAAMQVGLRQQNTWNRWLILGASDQYWSGDAAKMLQDPSLGHVKRVYLLTGKNDQVADATKRVEATLRKGKVPVRVRIVDGMGHEVPQDKMVTTYRRPLAWLVAPP